jgi:hypothetical protein
MNPSLQTLAQLRKGSFVAYWGENGPLVVWASPPAARACP